ncbi:hypothetical protein ACFL0V_02370 [Nanoarchaeota archaeon]
MSLKEKLLETRVSLEKVDLSAVVPTNVLDEMEVKGRIAERLAYEWLCKVGVSFDEDFPRRTNGYNWNLTPQGILVTAGKRTVHEFDFLVSDEREPYVVEVKSLKLNGVESRIPRALSLASELYGREARMLVMFPTYHNKVRDAERLNSIPRVEVVDLGYRKKQLLRAINEFYSLRARS